MDCGGMDMFCERLTMIAWKCVTLDSSFLSATAVNKTSKANSLSVGFKYKRGGEKLWFSTEITVYLGNGTR